MRERLRLAGMAALVMLGVAGCLPLPGGYTGHDSPIYSDPANWICRPGKAGNVCGGDLDATVVPADGNLSVERFHPTPVPLADCFYVYGTISHDPGLLSDLDWSMADEGRFVKQEAARFGSACRVFAPVYRSVTATALADGRAAADPETSHNAPYADVLDAWRQYIAHDNGGRNFIIIGHSQGAALLGRLLKEEIEPDPQLRSHLVAADLIGSNIQVAAGSDRGGPFQTPVCSRFGQSGCIVTYNSYRSTIPPGPLGLFGADFGNWDDIDPHWPADGRQAACVNPAALLDPHAAPGARAWLTPYFDTALTGPGPWVDPAHGTPTTPQVKLPRFVEGECVQGGANGIYHYLQITVHGNPADPRVDDIGGDLEIPGLVTKDMFGLHTQNTHLAEGDLVRLAALQSFTHIFWPNA